MQETWWIIDNSSLYSGGWDKEETRDISITVGGLAAIKPWLNGRHELSRSNLDKRDLPIIMPFGSSVL